MSDNLRKLIEAVETGTLDSYDCGRYGSFLAPYCNGKTIFLTLPLDAFNGSVDAAIVLCEALLPGWEWAVYGRGTAHLWKQLDRVSADDSIPARALLLAVLRAKLTEIENE